MALRCASLKVAVLTIPSDRYNLVACLLEPQPCVVMFELGQTSCLRVDGGSYLARCEMKLNVSSWTRIQDGCPVTERMQQQMTRAN